eukprot:gene21622-27985_t
MSLSTLQYQQIEVLLNKAIKYSEENPIIVGSSVLSTIITSYFIFRKPVLKRDGNDFDNQLTGSVKILNNSDHTIKRDEFSKSINDYEGLFTGARSGQITSEESVDQRKARYADMVNHFYNLVTDFYEWGWGQSFHFGPRFHNETFVESIKRAEYYLAARLGMKRGTKAIDVGCGVGGPMRNIAIFSESNIEGITINQYQVNIGNKYNAKHGLQDRCKLNQGDFQELPWNPETFDVAYAIEATCHSPDRVTTFSGINKVLKPNGLFAGYEWVMLDKYDPNNLKHVKIKEGIEVGNGLPTLQHYSHIVECLEKAGFEVLEHRDANEGVHAPNQLPWYETLEGKLSLTGFRMSWIGRLVTHSTVWLLELFRIAPNGSTQVSSLLNATALDLVDGGKLEIFTPSYFFLARKK